MNIEKSLDIIKGKLLLIDKMLKQDQEEGRGSAYEMQTEDFEAIETLLTAYEKEKEKNKKIENELKDITKKYMEAESVKFWYNYIHKDKIRKMLQELEDRRNKQPVIGYWSKKAMLEKLLKEE